MGDELSRDFKTSTCRVCVVNGSYVIKPRKKFMNVAIEKL